MSKVFCIFNAKETTLDSEALHTDDRLLVTLQENLTYVNRAEILTVVQRSDGSWSIDLRDGRSVTRDGWVAWWLEIQAVSKKAGNPVRRADLWFEDFLKGKSPSQSWADEQTVDWKG